MGYGVPRPALADGTIDRAEATELRREVEGLEAALARFRDALRAAADVTPIRGAG